jgi:hypothetical protein
VDVRRGFVVPRFALIDKHGDTRSVVSSDDPNFTPTLKPGQEGEFVLLEDGERPEVVLVERGPRGRQGEPGEPGERGPAGAQGADGKTGATGPRGAAGPQGNQGLAGPQGAKGDPGERGPAGATGLTGPMGPSGQIGPIGLTGPMGPVGPQGAQGPTGATGATGPRGPAGAPGEVVGNQLLHGNGEPNRSRGQAGDFYLDAKNMVLYGPKTPAGWQLGFKLSGERVSHAKR